MILTKELYNFNKEIKKNPFFFYFPLYNSRIVKDKHRKSPRLFLVEYNVIFKLNYQDSSEKLLLFVENNFNLIILMAFSLLHHYDSQLLRSQGYILKKLKQEQRRFLLKFISKKIKTLRYRLKIYIFLLIQTLLFLIQ